MLTAIRHRRRSIVAPLVSILVIAAVTQPVAVAAGAQSIHEFDQPFVPTAITAAPGGAIWIGEQWAAGTATAYGIGLKMPGEPRHDFALPGKVVAIAAASASKAWFITYGPSSATGAAIGLIGPSGHVQLLALNDQPTTIVTGANGTVWFNEPNRWMIAKIDPPFNKPWNLVEYPVPQQPTSLVLGPDADVWFAGYFPSGFPGEAVVSKIAPTGQVTVSPPLCQPFECSSQTGLWGSVAGAVWVMVSSGNAKLLRVLPDFSVAVSVPFDLDCCSAMTGSPSQPDAWGLMVDEGTFDFLVRIEPDGSQSTFFLPDETFIRERCCNGEVALTADGSVLFTEPYWNEIGLFVAT